MFDQKMYAQLPDAVTETEAFAIYQRLAPSDHRSDTQEDQNYRDDWQAFIDTATTYLKHRAIWLAMPQSERFATGALRSSRHNAYMAALTALSRSVAKPGESRDWLTERLGDHETYRKRWGDLAGYLLLFTTIEGR